MIQGQYDLFPNKCQIQCTKEYIFVLANVCRMHIRATECNAAICRIQPVKLLNVESVSRKIIKDIIPMHKPWESKMARQQKSGLDLLPT